jgi:hypothetical protein
MTRAGRQLALLLACLIPAATLCRGETRAMEVEAPATRPATQPATRPSLEQLLVDLSADDWKLRQQAADALGDLDAASLPKLKHAAGTSTDPDIRNALETAIRRIEQTAAASPSMVSLSFKNAPAVDVMNALADQLSYPLAYDGDEWLKNVNLSIDAKDQPFWGVLKQLAPQWTGRPVQTTNDPTRIVFAATGTNYVTARAAVAGPFLVCPVMLMTNGQVDLLGDKPAVKFRNLNLQLMVLAEPKVRLSRLIVTAKQAVDDNGKVIALENMSGMQPMTVMGTQPMTLLPLRLPGEVGKTLAKLSGVVRARVPSRLRHVEMNDALGGKEQSVDLSGKAVKVLVKQREDLYDVRLQVPTMNGMVDEATQAVVRDLSVIDAEGRPLARRAFAQTPNVKPNVWEYTVIFTREGTNFGQNARKAGEPAKLIWELAVEPKELDVPFELSNLPIAVQ